MTKKGTILLFILTSCIAQGSHAPEATDKTVQKKQRKEAMKVLADQELQDKIVKLEKEKSQLIQEIKELKTDFEKSRKNFDTSIELAEKNAQEYEQKYIQKEQALEERQEAIDTLSRNVAIHAISIKSLEDEKTQLNDELNTQKTANESAINTIKTLTKNLQDSNADTGNLINTLYTTSKSLANWKLGSSILAGVTIVSLLGNFLLGYCHSHKCDKADGTPSTTAATPEIAQAAADEVSVAPVLPEEEPFTIQQDQETAGFETDADEQDEESFPQAIPTVSDVSEPQESELIAAA